MPKADFQTRGIEICPPLPGGLFNAPLATLGAMTPTTKAELLAAVTANQAEIEQLVPQLKGIIGDPEWQATFDRIVALRKAREELEGKLAALRK